jgi:Sulfotransferase domain
MNVNETAGSRERVFSSYPPDQLAKAIHLIRDPFDNVVSRFHLERQLPGREAAKFEDSREGFRSYCKSIDNAHKANEKRVIFLSDQLLEIMRTVPCHEDFFRYIEWHNLAFFTARDLELDTYVLRYDSYRTRYNETVNELLDFLKLTVHKNGQWVPFYEGYVYSNYFTDNEKRAVAEAFEIMSSSETWKHVRPYFDKLENRPLRLPHLDQLVRVGSETEIIGDVQFLLDFAIVGYPKTATTNMLRWLGSQQEIQMHDHEVYHFKNNVPAEMVRELYALPEGDYFKRGYKAPRDIHNIPAVDAFAKYFPKTKLIVGLRHPVLWFESFYNYRLRSNVTLLPPNDLIGYCTREMYNVCTEEIRYMDHLSNIGKTARTDPDELKLLSPVPPRHRATPKLDNPIFLYEISQMEETDEVLVAQFRQDLQSYLGLTQPIEPLTELKESHDDDPFHDVAVINICDPEYTAVHDDLMDIAQRSSMWLRQYFLPLPDVHVSSPDHFHQLMENWMMDPCLARASG